MNQFQTTQTGKGLLKDFYDEDGKTTPLEAAIKKRRKSRRKSKGLDLESLDEEIQSQFNEG